jgi:hypothetical protein
MEALDWNAIGAIGEILGAFAVVLTLVYLAGQIKQARKATLNDLYARRAKIRLQRHDTLAHTHPKFHEIWLKHVIEREKMGWREAYEALDESERPFFREHTQGFVTALDQTYYQWLNGNMPGYDIDKLANTIRTSYPLWEAANIDYPSPEFEEFVRVCIKDGN